ncbi:hypothetical protein Q5H92_14335 [Hymenobacter sp. M29]|uniref:Lipoprotein n=1 Tax=Hymenobacter mellowenesis TaxID=3063995 RepID=A0ABT9ACG1_9BACT|nr:hypothetical protein [Hymenobacter sp. M29]MDO7847544.1 hypothetical protein [Hymenobacter sp. M29]
MKQFYYRTKFAASVLATSLGINLASCGENCENYNCTPCTETENLVVRIETDSRTAGSFTSAEVAGAYLVRYARPGFATPLDTIRTGICGPNLFCAVNLQYLPLPVANGAGPALVYLNYNYRFVLPRVNRSYDLTDLDVADRPGGPGCCSCAMNLRRRAVLNGVAVADDGAGAGNGIVLRR